jgi:hypothetical protein
MSALSPAAQAVMDAATAPTGDFCLENVNEIAAAALRAAADQVVPEEPWPVSMMGPVYVAEAKQRRKLRQHLLAIAAELAPEPS